MGAGVEEDEHRGTTRTYGVLSFFIFSFIKLDL